MEAKPHPKPALPLLALAAIVGFHGFAGQGATVVVFASEKEKVA